MFIYFCLFYVRSLVTSTLRRAHDTIISTLSHTMIRVVCGHSFVIPRVSFTSTICHSVASASYLVSASLIWQTSDLAL